MAVFKINLKTGEGEIAAIKYVVKYVNICLSDFMQHRNVDIN